MFEAEEIRTLIQTTGVRRMRGVRHSLIPLTSAADTSRSPPNAFAPELFC